MFGYAYRDVTTIESKINTRSKEFAENAAHLQAQVDDLRAKVEIVKAGGGTKHQERQTSRGKMLVRDRITALINSGSPFLELSQLAAMDVYGEDVAAAGIVTGVGHVAGKKCMIVANVVRGIIRLNYGQILFVGAERYYIKGQRKPVYNGSQAMYFHDVADQDILRGVCLSAIHFEQEPCATRVVLEKDPTMNKSNTGLFDPTPKEIAYFSGTCDKWNLFRST